MILELIIMSSKICCNLQVLPWMETKCGNQTLHGKCYLCTKPGYSGAANNGDSELFSIDGINNFSVRLSFIAHKLLLLFFLRIETGPVWRGLR